MSKTARKIENIRRAFLKSEFERTFWQRKTKYYAPNRINDHYEELDKLWAEYCIEAMESEIPIDNQPIPENSNHNNQKAR